MCMSAQATADNFLHTMLEKQESVLRVCLEILINLESMDLKIIIGENKNVLGLIREALDG